jgi:hypothetical protein
MRLIIADFECKSGHITEHYVHHKQKKVVCPVCGKNATRIISVNGQYCANQDAPWIKSVLDVVDKTSTKPHVRDFLKHPTRANYKAWMKGEGIRPADHREHGSAPTFQKPPEPDIRVLGDKVYERFRDRNRIEVRS